MKKTIGRKSIIGLSLAAIAYVFLAIYLVQPVFHIRYTGFIKMVIPFLVAIYLLELKRDGRLDAMKMKRGATPFLLIPLALVTVLPIFLFVALLVDYLVEKKKGRKLNNVRYSRYVMLGIIAYTALVPFFTSGPMFHSDRYRNLIGEVRIETDLDDLYPPISEDGIRVVDQDMARRLGDKTLGADPSIGSQAELGTFNIQSVNGQLYWVAPLLHSGFFKWRENREGTTGYVMVSATDDSETALVQEAGGRRIRIKYQPDSFFSEDLSRHIYLHGYMTRGFEDFSFEIDDQGNPHWVVTLFEKRIGFRGKDASGVIIIDCGTGEMEEYAIGNTPAWVDRIQPETFIKWQIDNWGEYVHGAFNFSDREKLTTTQELSLVYGKEGRSFWYTGLTSVGSDEGTVGFILVDTRTKEAFWYKQAGATESAARASAEGKVQEKRYTATKAVIYNLGGVPTYIMSLTDNAGLVKMYAAVSVADYTKVEVGETLSELLMNYRGRLRTSGAGGPSSSPEAETAWTDLDGAVFRISSEVAGGNTFYYLILVERPGTILEGQSRLSRELPLTRPGDRVRVRYLEDSEQEILDLQAFDNMEF